MSVTPTSSELFALLIIITQTLSMVLALPTSGATMNTSAQLETGRASHSNRNGNDNDRGDSSNNNVVPPKNTTALRFVLPPCRAITLSTGTIEFALQAMLSQFNKRDNSKDQKHDSHDMSPGEVAGIVIAALTLLAGIIPLFRCSRFHHWMSSSISPTIKNITEKFLGIKLLNPVSTTPEDPSANPAPIPHSVRTHNNHSDAQLVGASCDTLQGSGDSTDGEGGRALPGRALPASTRPERAFTYPLPLGLAMGPGEIRCSLGKPLPMTTHGTEDQAPIN